MVERFEGRHELREASRRPRGGNVSEKPFSQALYRAMKAAGFESQSSLAAKSLLEQKHISAMIRGVGLPTMATMTKVLDALGLGVDSDLAKVWTKAKVAAIKEKSFKLSKFNQKKAESTLGEWFDDLALSVRLSRKDLFESFGMDNIPGSLFLSGYRTDLRLISETLQKMASAYELSSERQNSLADALDRKINKDMRDGKVYESGNLFGRGLNRAQAEMNCMTYTGAQAALALGISRQRVKQLRDVYGFPVLMSQEQLNQLKNRPGRRSRGQS